MRLLDLALPHLGPDRSLRFAILPEGQDPDDLIRAQGSLRHAGGHRPAEPLVKLLWRRETEGRSSTHPNGAPGSMCACAPPSG
jgi:DNA primase